MTKAEMKQIDVEIDKLNDICVGLVEKLSGDLYVEYCENDEELDDVGPMMEIAADEARYKIANERWCQLTAKRAAERKKRKKK